VTPSSDFWRGKRVLITGHSGFKGSWLSLWLEQLGAQLTGLSLPPEREPSLFTLNDSERHGCSKFCDIRDATTLAALVREARPEIVFHLAAQPLVRASYQAPLATFSTNVLGTVHLLDALRHVNGLRVALMVTTDKVYHNEEWPWPYRETDALGGHDPYSVSKAASELVINSYRNAFLQARGVAVASACAGNVIGGGDWSEDRLLPDAVRAWQSGQTLDIRNPDAVRPWQHVLDALAGYLALAHHLWDQPELVGAYNFGPATADAASVRELIELARQTYASGDVRYGQNPAGPHEARLLSLDSAKAQSLLGFRPHWHLHDAVRHTMAWYRAQRDGADTRKLCAGDIAAWEAAA